MAGDVFLGSVYGNLELRTTQFNAQADAANAKMSEMEGKANTSMASMGSGFIAAGTALTLGLTLPIIGLGAMAVKEFETTELAQARLGKSFQFTGGITRETAQSLIDYAESLQKVTAFSDEEITSALAMMGTFSMTADQAKQLTPGLLDAAAALERVTGQRPDLEQLALQMGKAVGSGSVGMLKKWGLQLTDVQQEAFKMASTQERVNILTEAFASNFGGAAAAQAQTLTGQWRQMKNELMDALKPMGKMLMDIIAPMVTKMKELSIAFQNTSPEFKKLVGSAALLLAALGPILLIVGGLMSAVTSIAGGIEVLGGVLSGIVSVASAVGGAVGAFLALGFWPVTLIVLGILLLIGVLIVVKKHWEEIKAKLQPVFDLFRMLATMIMAQLRPAFEQMVIAWQNIKKSLEPIMPYIEKLALILGGVLLVTILAVPIALMAVALALAFVLKYVSQFVAWITNFEAVKTTFLNIGTAISNFFTNLWNSIVNGLANIGMAFLNFLMNLPTTIAFWIGFAVGTWISILIALPGIVWNILVSLAQFIWNGMVMAYNFFTQTLPQYAASLGQWLSGLPGAAWGWIMNMASMIGQGASNAWSQFNDWISRLPGVLSNVFNNISSYISGLPGKIGQQLRDVAKAGWEGFKAGLGISSPSYIEVAFFNIGAAAIKTLAILKDTMKQFDIPPINTTVHQEMATVKPSASLIAGASSSAPAVNLNIKTGPFLGTPQQFEEFGVTVAKAVNRVIKAKGNEPIGV
jgi:hypothetical protein